MLDSSSKFVYLYSNCLVASHSISGVQNTTRWATTSSQRLYPSSVFTWVQSSPSILVYLIQNNLFTCLNFRIRKCQSPYETFYEGKCYRTGIPGNPCPRYQQLYNGPDNNGYCYCQRNGGKLNGLVYMDGQCYMQNEQVSDFLSQNEYKYIKLTEYFKGSLWWWRMVDSARANSRMRTSTAGLSSWWPARLLEL